MKTGFSVCTLVRAYALYISAPLLKKNSPHLSGVIERVTKAGCEVLPDWAAGAVLLVPLTQEQVAEAGITNRPSG